ncbi:MAG: hypothetical protein H0Z28_11175 [Archaeoglobus sp.]|nr:hypothetical protein [Archaeoglobus sp.]
MKVPNKNFSGVRFGLKFNKGVAETDNEKIAMHLKSLGYSVKKLKSKNEGKENKEGK